MKRMALVARVTVWTAMLAAALVGRSASATSPGCTQPLFAPPPPHFTMPNAGPWAGYRGAAIEHDWPEARAWLAGPRPPSLRPLRTLLAWLEGLLMPRSHRSRVCVDCQWPPIGMELGYDPLPGEKLNDGDEPAPPLPVPEPAAPGVPQPEATPAAPMPPPVSPPSPLFNPLPDELVPQTPPATSPPVAPDPPIDPTEPKPPANVVPQPEPTPTETKPAELKPPGGPIVELAPEVTLPIDPPVRTLPPRNTVPNANPKPPKNLVPRYTK